MLVACSTACAADYRSIAEPAAILYDAPSTKAKKRFILGRGYPVEVVVAVEGWTKIRDAGGELAWVENKSLSERRSVMVKAPLAEVRVSADDKAPVVFQAEQNVLLDLNELTGSGWARVTHRDGQSGYLKVTAVWGL